ncbi:putative hemolysin [Chitinivorax tropicus]|uniref:L-ornithine N(alpha)-acyltransferase n=1 Tax=Chitinivorax tropicus TaxID=714531 RepID=A0A840MQ71_9PROT|nr:GNAT family N-acyltransferase [Chitinivorax tropicus]MBB5018323.1 putative hemolysin [Chitinivorax tropicus]
MLHARADEQLHGACRLSVTLATTRDEVLEAQRLRYQVFAEELGARLDGQEPGIDQDMFDPFCEHLLVRDDTTGEVVGTYRILAPSAARKIGNYYSESEFDLVRLANLRNRMVEVGRSCVHRDYRSGGVITLLWSGLSNYMVRNGYEYLMGCASISMADGGHNAVAIYDQIKDQHLSPVEWRAFPRCPLPMQAIGGSKDISLPPLIKGYLRVGAMVCGEPAWDPDFNTADLLMLLPMAQMNRRYLRHFVNR